MTDPLTWLWPHMDTPQPLFSEQMVRTWPDGALDRLRAAGFVTQAQSADRVVCPACIDGHFEDVVAMEWPDGSCRFFVYCPEVLRAEVSPEDLRQWTIDFEALLGAVAKSMSLKGKFTAVAPGRLWRLGKAVWQGALRDVLFARGLAWKDGAEVARRIAHSRWPIALVAEQAPPPGTWVAQEPAIVPLAQVASLGQEEIVLDGAVMAAIIADADATRAEGDVPLLDDGQLRRLIRAERDVALGDGVLVAAYKQHGSYRKAAAALIAQGVHTDRWAVERAVRRAGGPAAICRGESSRSVVRSVVSHRRDSRKIFRRLPQPETGD